MTDITDIELTAIEADFKKDMDSLISSDPDIRRKGYDQLFSGKINPDVEVKSKQDRSMQEILRDAEVNAGSTDSHQYLRLVNITNADLAGRLRHRAAMMRVRADEFDQLASLYEAESLKKITEAVATYDTMTAEIEELLRQHNHIKPYTIGET